MGQVFGSTPEYDTGDDEGRGRVRSTHSTKGNSIYRNHGSMVILASLTKGK
jgi:hypothetical protein